MRLHVIIIAFIMFSLFGTVLMSQTQTFLNGYNITDLTSGTNGKDTNTFLKSINKTLNMTSELKDLSGYSPGGGSLGDNVEESSENNILLSGYRFVSRIGNFVFKYPAAMLNTTIGFFGIDPIFNEVAIAILIVIVTIILVSSVLKNRL